MGYLVSPGVTVTETDLTIGVPTVATSNAAFVGKFRWGPLSEVKLVESEKELVEYFHKPDADTYQDFLVAESYLAYSDKLRLVRVADEASAKNATADGNGLLIKNKDHYEATYADGSGNVGLWAGKYPGALGNSLKVSLCHKTAYSRQVAITSSSGTTVTVSSASTKFVVGDYITYQNQTRKVVTVNAGDVVIDQAFSPDLGGVTVTVKWEYWDSVGVAPGTSDYAAARGAADDEIHVVVVDEDGAWTGVKGTVLEKYPFASLASDAKNSDGTTAYYAAAINQKSKYIWWMDHHASGSNWGSAVNGITFTAVGLPATYSLAGGVDSNSTVDNADKIAGWNIFKSKELYDVSVLIAGVADATLAEHIIQNVAEYRTDCVAVLSPEAADVINNASSEVSAVVAFRNSLTSSSYAVLDDNWKYMYDRYNDVYRWIPCNGDVAGLISQTDTKQDPWWSPAGFNRGRIKNAVKLAWNATKTERDELYLNGINSICSFPGQGLVLYGDKTLLSRPSAFDHINVRRLFIVLEKAIAKAARYFLFEFNDEFTRAQFRQMVEPYLRDVQARRGIQAFKVVCDSTNNTGEVIDRNEFVGDIYIKPARAINYIKLNFVAVGSDVAFTEVTDVQV